MDVGVESYMLQLKECIVRHHLTVSRGMIIACMQFLGIEVHQRLNGYAWIQWQGIAGSPYSDGKLHSLKLSFLNSSFQDSLYFNFTHDGNRFT